MPENYAIELCESIIRPGLKINLTTMGVNPRFSGTARCDEGADSTR